MLEDEIRNGRQRFQGVRRIGKDKIELFSTSFDISEGVGAKWNASVGLHCFHDFADESEMLRIVFNGYDPIAPPRKQFDTDASRAGKQIQGTDTVGEVDIVSEHVEQVFFSEIRRRTSLEGVRYFEVSSSVYAADYSHASNVCRSKGTSCRRVIAEQVNSELG